MSCVAWIWPGLPMYVLKKAKFWKQYRNFRCCSPTEYWAVCHSVLLLAVPVCILFVFGPTAPPPVPQWATPSLLTRFVDHTQRRTAVGKTPLDEWSARRRDLYLTTLNTHNRQTSIKRAVADQRLRPRGPAESGSLHLTPLINYVIPVTQFVVVISVYRSKENCKTE